MTDKQEPNHAFARSLSNAGVGEWVGVDPASGTDKTVLGIVGKNTGKNARMEKMKADFLKKNPDATIIYIGVDETRIEKVVKETPLLLPNA